MNPVNPRPTSERFTSIVNVPQTIALKYPTGKQTRYGSIMYTLSDGRVAFFKPEVAQQIDALHLSPGQPFTICDRARQGWEIEYAHQPSKRMDTRPQLSTAVDRPVPTKLEDALKTAITVAHNAEKFAHGLDYPVRFRAEDIRAMGLTILIGMQRQENGGVR